MKAQSDQDVITDAEHYAREHRARIAKAFVDTEIYPGDEKPWTVLMAGSPGAGKTEVSTQLVATLEGLSGQGFEGLGKVLRIDPDEFRQYFPAYNGANSRLFNSSVTKIVEKVLDRAFAKHVSFILDGTLASETVARKNIERSLAKGRDVTILYVYQDPMRAWDFVQSREAVEGRNIPLEAFVSQFFSCRRSVTTMKEQYGDLIRVDLLIQASEGVGEPTIREDVSADLINATIADTYEPDQLIRLLKPEVNNE